MRITSFHFLILSLLTPVIIIANEPHYEDILELEQVAFLNCMFTDMHGHSKEIIIPRKSIDTAIKYGISFDSSQLVGVPHKNLLLKLNVDTLTIVPWTDTDSKTARVICNLAENTQTPSPYDVRSFLEQAIEEAQQMGYDFVVGPTVSFFFYKDNGSKYIPYDSQDYVAAENNPYATSLKRTLLNVLLAQNIGIEKIEHAIAPGQYALSIKPGIALTIADQLMITQQTIHALAHAHSLKATFMPKPLQEYNGNSLYIQCSLWNRTTESNAFYDEQDPAHLSPLAKQFIAGILTYLPEVQLIFNSTVNAYKRLNNEFNEAAAISTTSTKTLIHIPSIEQPSQARIVLRFPDGACCPYLVLGVLLKLGLEGIKQNMSYDEHTSITLVSSLEHALVSFEQSSSAKKIIGNSLFEELLHHKKQEWQRYNSFVTDWEVDAYFES